VMLAVAELTPHVGLRSACQAFALNRGFVYRDRARRHRTASRCVPRARPRPPLALSRAERELLLGLLDSERFADATPATVYATLLDEGRYHGSIRTMYRLLTEQRAITLDAAFAAHLIRFKGVAPKPPALPTATWINPPQKQPTQAPIKPSCSLN
jgi:hypothetical protein